MYCRAHNQWHDYITSSINETNKKQKVNPHPFHEVKKNHQHTCLPNPPHLELMELTLDLGLN